MENENKANNKVDNATFNKKIALKIIGIYLILNYCLKFVIGLIIKFEKYSVLEIVVRSIIFFSIVVVSLKLATNLSCRNIILTRKNIKHIMVTITFAMIIISVIFVFMSVIEMKDAYEQYEELVQEQNEVPRNTKMSKETINTYLNLKKANVVLADYLKTCSVYSFISQLIYAAIRFIALCIEKRFLYKYVNSENEGEL